MPCYEAKRVPVVLAAAVVTLAAGACVRPVMLSGTGSLHMTLPLDTELVYVREAPSTGWSPGDTLYHRIVEFTPGQGRELKLDRVWMEPYLPSGSGSPEEERPTIGAGRTRADGPVIRIEARMGRLAPRSIFRVNTPAGMVRLTHPGDRRGDLLAPAPGTGVSQWDAGGRRMRVADPDTLIRTPAGDFRGVEV